VAICGKNIVIQRVKLNRVISVFLANLISPIWEKELKASTWRDLDQQVAFDRAAVIGQLREIVLRDYAIDT
jgi:hypothetical protein